MMTRTLDARGPGAWRREPECRLMDRRRFLTTLAGAALAAPGLTAFAPGRADADRRHRWVAVQRTIDGYVR